MRLCTTSSSLLTIIQPHSTGFPSSVLAVRGLSAFYFQSVQPSFGHSERLRKPMMRRVAPFPRQPGPRFGFNTAPPC
jgi:hypothetical protein